MELYLDSANLKEIEEGFKLGFLNGLTTTPTFMQREGITNIDATIVKLSKIVPVLQIEALGDTAEEILKEAERQLKLGLDPKKTVFKIPVSLEGVRACALLRKKGYLVNVHLVYTLQQAYMAMQAGATYVCPLVGRLQDQGHDALMLVEQCVGAVNYYGYNTKIMFSSVRNVEHVRNAINVGVHTITVPLKILKQLTENNFTTLGTEQFITDTRLMTVRVKDAMNGVNPIVKADTKLADAVIKMTEYGFGCITIVNKDGSLKGIFTDGDLRRALPKGGKDFLSKKMSDFAYKTPVSIDANELLNEAAVLFKKTNVDTILVTSKGKPLGMLDIQESKRIIVVKPEQVKQLFAKNGAKFILPPSKTAAKLKNIKAFVFDWDGVFNNGVKDERGSSPFNEVDSMGTNLLRFAFFYKNQYAPFTAVISGEKNAAASYWTKREHFNGSYYKVAHKTDAINHFCYLHNLKPSEVAYVFDDVLDLAVAETVGLRFFIPRKSNPMLTNFVIKNKLADYVTGAESGNFAVREVTEMLIALYGVYDKVMKERMHYTPLYENYATQRNSLETRYFTRVEGKIIEQHP